MKISLKFGPDSKGYIADPYWPEVFRIIEIRKRAGVDRARSEAKIRSGLEAYLRKDNMTLADYESLVVSSKRPFHTVNGEGSEIIIPADKILSCIVNTNDLVPARMRIESPRTSLTASDFKTGKTAPDGKWERFAVVKSGMGKQLSNQRGFRSSSYIREFTATGRIETDKEMVKPDAVIELLKHAGRVIGIGASRKMGWGRFEVVE
jgi:hypothetical protein